ncbi:MAG: hypothetical protein Q8O99_00930 [bacterium]|nr:hypothetical protein [bacterium]
MLANVCPHQSNNPARTSGGNKAVATITPTSVDDSPLISERIAATPEMQATMMRLYDNDTNFSNSLTSPKIIPRDRLITSTIIVHRPKRCRDFLIRSKSPSVVPNAIPRFGQRKGAINIDQITIATLSYNNQIAATIADSTNKI